MYLYGHQNNHSFLYHICKQVTKIFIKELLETNAKIFHSKNTVPYVIMKKLQKRDFHP